MTALEPRDDERERAHPDVSQSTGDRVVGSLIERLSDPCTSVELAAALGKSPKTIVDWCQEREYTNIPCFRLGNRSGPAHIKSLVFQGFPSRSRCSILRFGSFP